ncbi:hypothetical protein [Bradyrhizobium arachidis]|uniref:hypothetical protein n=1 Tax=Bradyrhizobium arachidis TaxID=858423 RepID=UPI0008E85ED0|nr:hypothetical protein [Bradyrhizobium arachidis]SFV13820.1 hypothetical protein SAMN05192541_120123 [Bradyrhizobium arachidis]
MVEVGNDPARNWPFERPKTPRKEIKSVVDRARARFERGERFSRTPKGISLHKMPSGAAMLFDHLVEL